jgi:serine/threonine protein kinase/Tfp pilus assembly protein PilF
MALSAVQMAQMSRLLDQALPLDAAGRRRWLELLSPEQQDLAAVLREALLPQTHLNPGSIGLATLPKIRGNDGSAIAISALNAGEHVGPYQLVRELGAGGMGEVWLARRADGAYKRDVALKLPRLVRFRKELEPRFARERDILASLEHPNIARLYDAGVSPDGLPYLAMEYVQGQRLTAWCDAHCLGLRERLKLFLQVIDAVQYAHVRRVIHRDLKPSNILVTESGQVRLLDFGVAKLLAEEETDRAPVIHFYARALTPDYASPELLRGEEVHMASDVYSLGAVLYELLSGDRPYRFPSGASAAQMEQVVASARPERPSSRVIPGAGIALATTRERLVGRLRGELDAIALMALAWCPADRYPSAAALANDLQRYLAGESVEAMPSRLTTEELITHLSRNPNVRVRARGKDEDAGSIVGRFGAAKSRKGSVRKSGKTLRIVAQLITASDGTHLWSQTYDLILSDALKVEEEIARTVANAVNSALDTDKARIEHKDTDSQTCNLLVQGDFFRRRFTKADTEKAIGFYRQALELNPGCSIAWATLALAYLTQAVQKWIPAMVGIERAREAVERSLFLDPNLARAHEARGMLYEKFYWNWAKAKAELLRARELDPVDDQASVRLALMIDAAYGRFDAAILVLRQALSRNPLDTVALQAMGWVQFAAGRMEESEAAYRTLLALNPVYNGANASLALTLVSMGRHSEALDAAQRESDEVSRLFALPIVFWTLGRPAESDAMLRKLENEYAEAGAYQIAQNYAYRGEIEAAFEWLDRAYRERDAAMSSIKVNPLLRSLHKDPRYEALLVTMKMAVTSAEAVQRD